MKKQWVVSAIVLAVQLAACGFAPETVPQDRTVTWDQAIEILNRGEVEMVAQAHSLEVTMRLKDGSQITTMEPQIDEIFEAVRRCGAPCDGIILATE